MKNGIVVKLLGVAACLALVLFPAQAVPPPDTGGPDTADITNISTTPHSTQSGGGKNYTLDADVDAGATISLTFTVGVSWSGSTSTIYSDTLKLTADTLVKPGADPVDVTGLTDCVLYDPRGASANTCSESATLTAPTTPGAYQVKILADDGRKGNEGKMNSDFFLLNFIVAEPSGCEPAETTLVLSVPDCVTYHAPSVSLSATLTSGTTPLVGKTITFFVDGDEVGTADTIAGGVATLTYDPSSLTVGDHVLSAAWQSDDSCLQNPTVTGAILGVEYLFQGFQPPINADGNTVLTGKCGPVKIRIVDWYGTPVSDATALVFFNVETPQIIGEDAENATTGLNFDYGNVMRYSDGQYVYNWDLSDVPNGTYSVFVYLFEGSCAPAHDVKVSVGKKSKR